jgi:ABC-2 type transport system permease protein
MTIPPNAVPESSLEVQAIAPAAMSATQPFYWSVRRELWENRSIYIAPIAAAGVAMLGFFISLVWLPRSMRAPAAADPGDHFIMLVMPYGHTAWLLLMAAFLVGVFSSLDGFTASAATAASFSGSRCRFPTSRPCFRRRAFRLWCCRCSYLWSPL